MVAHIKLCVLALLIQRVAELRAKRSWLRIRTELKAVCVRRRHQIQRRARSRLQRPELLMELERRYNKLV